MANPVPAPSNPSSPPSSIISLRPKLRGNWGTGAYSIALNIQDLTNSKGWVRGKDAPAKIPQNTKWHHLVRLTAEQIQTLVTGNFLEAFLETKAGQPHLIHLYVKKVFFETFPDPIKQGISFETPNPTFTSLTAPKFSGLITAQETSRRLNFLTISSSRDLAALLERGTTDRRAAETAHKMVDNFQVIQNPSEIVIKEMVELVSVVSPEDRWRIVQHLIDEYYRGTLTSQMLLRGLITVFETFENANSKYALQNQTDKNPISAFSPDDLLKLIGTLRDRLKETHRQNETNELLFHELQAIITIFEGMRRVHVDKIDREKYHKPIYELLDTFSKHGNLGIAFSACFGKQALVKIKDNESTLKTIVRHALSAGQGLGHIYKAYSDKNPFELINAFTKFKDALTFQELDAHWFTMLLFFQQAILETDAPTLKVLSDCLINDPEKLAKNFKKTDSLESDGHLYHFFVKGFIEILFSAIRQGSLKNREEVEIAILFLQRIWQDNIPKENIQKDDIAVRVFRVGPYQDSDKKEPSYQEQIRNEIWLFLKDCSGRKDLSILGQIKKSLEQLEKSARLLKITFTPPTLQALIPYQNSLCFSPVTSNEQFEVAADSIDITRRGLNRLFRAFLEDEDLKNELACYIELDARPEINTPVEQSKDLEKEIESFKQSEDTHLLIFGEAGTGKTTFIKKLILKKIMEYQNEGDEIPLYFDLSTYSLENAERKVLEGLSWAFTNNEQIQALCSRRLFVCFDAIDEIPFLIEGEQRRLFNLYLSNDLKRVLTHKQTKIAYTARLPVIKPDEVRFFYPDGKNPQYFRKWFLSPFTTQKQDFYLKKFLKNQKRLGENVPWNFITFKRNLKDIDVEDQVLGTPLYWTATARQLPKIVAKFERTKKDKAERLLLSKTRLRDEMFIERIDREYDRQTTNSNRPQYSKREYFEFQIGLIAKMNQSNKYVIPKDSDLCRNDFRVWLGDEKEAYYKRKATPLILKDGREWKFQHDELRAHLQTIWQQDRIDTVLKLMSDEIKHADLLPLQIPKIAKAHLEAVWGKDRQGRCSIHINCGDLLKTEGRAWMKGAKHPSRKQVIWHNLELMQGRWSELFVPNNEALKIYIEQKPEGVNVHLYVVPTSAQDIGGNKTFEKPDNTFVLATSVKYSEKK